MANPAPYPNLPVLEPNMALVALIVNVFVPGIGTIIAGSIGNKPMIGKGIAQFLLAIIFVGWVWGIVTGVQLMKNASTATAPKGTT